MRPSIWFYVLAPERERYTLQVRYLPVIDLHHGPCQGAQTSMYSAHLYQIIYSSKFTPPSLGGRVIAVRLLSNLGLGSTVQYIGSNLISHPVTCPLFIPRASRMLRAKTSLLHQEEKKKQNLSLVYGAIPVVAHTICPKLNRKLAREEVFDNGNGYL